VNLLECLSHWGLDRSGAWLRKDPEYEVKKEIK
jgi:hypothetical protein